MIRTWWHTLTLRSKMFLSFGLLILFSTVFVALYAISLTTSEMDAYALSNINRSIQYASHEISAQLRTTQERAVLFANDKTVRDALDGYASSTELNKYERWREIYNVCDLWIASKQVHHIRLHLQEDLKFLRDGLRFISGTDKVRLLQQTQPDATVLWDFFSQQGLYSCLAPIAGWRSMGYVEIEMDASPLLESLDIRQQTGMELFLSDGQVLMGADGILLPMDDSIILPEQSESTHTHQTAYGVKLLCTTLKMNGYPLYLVGRMPAALLSESAKGSLQSILALLVAVLALAFLMAWLISRSIFSRLEKLKNAMAQVETGSFRVQVDASEDELGQILQAFNHMAAELEITTETALRTQRISKETELRLLQAQINPHFINNTLESISWAAQGQDVPHVHYLVRNLSDFLRASLSKTQQISTVAQEIRAIRAYWNIQAYRFGQRIQLEVSVAPEATDVRILPMLLQPLVENALLHGILPKGSPGMVSLRLETCDDLLIIEVEDNGVGIPPDELEKLQTAIDSQMEGSYGLWNVHQRVRTQYGEEFGLSVQSTAGEGTLCILTIPVENVKNEKK